MPQGSTEETDLCFCCVLETTFRRLEQQAGDDLEAGPPPGPKQDVEVVRMVRIGSGFTVTLRVFVLACLTGVGAFFLLLVRDGFWAVTV